MFLHQVTDPVLEKEWLMLPSKLYGKNANRPLLLVDDVKKVFDPLQNSFLRRGMYQRWLIYDRYNFCSGRIAAFAIPGEITGRIGFYECTNDCQLAGQLLNAAVSWLQGFGCTVIEGPVNFGEKDRFWGLMVKGFERKGIYLDNFNPPCYVEHFRSFGFLPHETIFTYSLDTHCIPAEKLERVDQWSRKKYGYEYKPYCREQEEKLIPDIHRVYAKAFSSETRIGHISVEDIRHLIDQARPLLSETFFWLAYHKGEAVGFIIFLNEPSLDKQQVALLKGFALATTPEVRHRGVEAGLALSVFKALQQSDRPYQLVLSGINAKTRKMNSLIKKLGGGVSKIHQTFLYKTDHHESSTTGNT